LIVGVKKGEEARRLKIFFGDALRTRLNKQNLPAQVSPAIEIAAIQTKPACAG
jgi:hypothetical protein